MELLHYCEVTLKQQEKYVFETKSLIIIFDTLRVSTSTHPLFTFYKSVSRMFTKRGNGEWYIILYTSCSVIRPLQAVSEHEGIRNALTPLTISYLRSVELHKINIFHFCTNARIPKPV